MERTRKAARSLLLLLLIAMGLGPFSSQPAADETGPVAPLPSTNRRPAVTLRAGSGATIRFKTRNGLAAGDTPPETRDVPHLVLRHNGALADPAARTLLVEVADLTVPPAGVTVTIRIETQHGDPDVGTAAPSRITVWRASRQIANTTGVTRTGASLALSHTFTATVGAGADAVATPTDYFRYDLSITDAQHPAANPVHVVGRDYAFLLESQWLAPLPEVREASAGAAPDDLMVYYYDMAPFRRDVRDTSTWVPRARVPAYIGTELIPAMVEAYRVQTDVWNFPWYDAWTSYRAGRDAERLSVALTDGETWFHGRAPGQGHAAMSINVSRGKPEYATLTNGLMSTFHHELFHTQQRNIYLHHGGEGKASGAENAWDVFTEGTAVLASAVGQPDTHFDRTWGLRAYAFHARNFVGADGLSKGDLNTSYGRISGYSAAAYWRFLYEQCGGMRNGARDPAAGMAVIKQVLHDLYAGAIVDIGTSTDLVGALPAILDQALERPSCPFDTYEESLLAFARAIYGLRLEGGRCTVPGFPQGCSFYDPAGVYADPPRDVIVYRGEKVAYARASQPHPAGIPSSFGTDLIEVSLDPRADGSALTIAFQAAPTARSEFAVQVWHLNTRGPGARPQLSGGQLEPTILTTGQGDRYLVHRTSTINTSLFDRLALIITRTDTGERQDPEGGYTLWLYPDAEHLATAP
jgi:hypothetical protein